MSKSSTSAGGSLSLVWRWVRWWVSHLGWFSRSPPPSSPQPSATLAEDDENVREVPEHIARTLSELDATATAVLEGRLRGLVIFAADANGTQCWYYLADEHVNLEPIAVAIQSFGFDLHKQAARTQGNAPRTNRSEQKQ